MKFHLKATGSSDRATNNRDKGQCLPSSSTLIRKSSNQQSDNQSMQGFLKVADQTDVEDGGELVHNVVEGTLNYLKESLLQKLVQKFQRDENYVNYLLVFFFFSVYQ